MQAKKSAKTHPIYAAFKGDDGKTNMSDVVGNVCWWVNCAFMKKRCARGEEAAFGHLEQKRMVNEHEWMAGKSENYCPLMTGNVKKDV